MKKLRNRIKTAFLAGLAVVVPLFVTFFTVAFIVNKVDRVIIPVLFKTLAKMGTPHQYLRHIPGLGLILTLLFIFLTGLFATNILGRKVFHLGETILERIPFVRGLYTSAKQLVETVISASSTGSFKRVVMVEYPRKGIWSIAFVTGPAKGKIEKHLPPTSLTLFIPTTPNPTSGLLIIVPEKDVVPMDMSVEEGIKLVVSGGLIQPGAPPLPGHAGKAP
jgi:uncharacterized membrane protein